MNKSLLLLLQLLLYSLSVSAQKTVYMPKSISNRMDLNSSSSQWCYVRSRESDNVVVFWESGFGSDPSTAPGDYRVDITTLLKVAEKCYSFYRDTLQFALEGSSVTDKHKLIIFLLYTTDWTANGSGEDELVGSLRVSPWAAGIDNVVAHEMGHCFQYITGCDGDGGYRYGLGENGKGGNGFWEQCAQWMSFKVYPQKQFTENDFGTYIKSTHLHILHETPRYANYFLPDYWTYKHDLTFTGTLWRDSRKPEDPVETYKRLNSLTQEQFNDEMYEHAARLTTWDIPAIKSYGEKYIDSRAQVKMSRTSDKYWLVDPSQCIENYGYNSIKLNAPAQETEVAVRFSGKTGASGYRAVNTEKGGWRFGFVALCKDGTRYYSDRGAAKMENGKNPEASLSFNCPADGSKLWLVVSGAPQEHWKHEWDDNPSNDEQWPYQVQFVNTNLLGNATEINGPDAEKIAVVTAPVMVAGKIRLPEAAVWELFNPAGRQVDAGYGNAVDLRPLSDGGYILRYSGRCVKVTKSQGRSGKIY